MTVTALLAVLFYFIIPGAGAVLVRRRWRRFRRAVLMARNAAPLTYGRIRGTTPGTRYQFFAKLEAIQDDRRIWVGDRTLSVMVSLDAVPVFVIPHVADRSANLVDETPRVLYWKDLAAVAEGTDVFVSGCVIDDRGSIRITACDGEPPLVAMFDGSRETFFARAMWSGRQRNEYWNHLTPISLVGGFVAEVLWAVTVVETSRLQALLALVAAVIPALPLFPPGVVAFYWYRRIWRGARRVRARRDLAQVQNTELPGGPAAATLSRVASRRELAAVGLLIAGIAVNAYLLAAIVAILIR